jgi:acetyl/propionyl-CoA carboxylase alpha subunit
VRVDTHVYAGYTIPPNYDSMIGKLIVSAQTREEAITKMERALSEYVIEGVSTTIPFHLQLMQNEQVPQGQLHHEVLGGFRDQEAGVAVGRSPLNAFDDDRISPVLEHHTPVRSALHKEVPSIRHRSDPDHVPLGIPSHLRFGG